MQALKTFIDVRNRRITRGQAAPDDYDKPTLTHYTRLGLIGDAAANKSRAASARPRNTKPAAPQQPDEGATSTDAQTPEAGAEPTDAAA